MQDSESVGPFQHDILDVVYLSRQEFDHLQNVKVWYNNLTQNLIHGGVDEHTIKLLSFSESTNSNESGHAPTPSTIATSEDGGARLSSVTTPTLQSEILHETKPHLSYNHASSFRRNESSGDWADLDPVSDDLSYEADAVTDMNNEIAPQVAVSQAIKKPHYDRYAHRTIILSNLAEGVTHAEITAIVRGGMLLDIYLRTHDRSCAVSFLNAAEAKTFYDHIRRHNLYLRNKRVEIRWADRHFVLPGHVANKIGTGATRNLVVRRCDPNISADAIREDLNHIHNLVVIKVEFRGGNCFISTNSVHNAMFARTCMMSRAKFKGSKIEWDADECANPIEKVRVHRPRQEPVPVKKGLNPMANRFQLLNIEDDEDENISSFPADISVGITA